MLYQFSRYFILIAVFSPHSFHWPGNWGTERSRVQVPGVVWGGVNAGTRVFHHWVPGLCHNAPGSHHQRKVQNQPWMQDLVIQGEGIHQQRNRTSFFLVQWPKKNYLHHACFQMEFDLVVKSLPLLTLLLSFNLIHLGPRWPCLGKGPSGSAQYIPVKPRKRAALAE